MKFKLIFLGLIFFYNHSNAQITFEKVIDTLGSTSAFCVRETLDGGFVFCGYTHYGGNDIQIIKLDSIANIQWAKSYSGSGGDYATEIEQLADSTYIVNGAHDAGSSNCKTWLLALDTAGDSLWSQLYSAGPGATNVDFINSMAVINNNLVGLTGYYSPLSPAHTRGYFFSVNGTGFELSSRLYDYSLFGIKPRAIATTSNNEFLITGGIGTDSSSTDIFLMRITTLGDTIWFKTFDFSSQESGYDVIQTSDNGILVVGFTINPSFSSGNMWLIKTDANGDTLWTKIFAQSSEQIAHSVQETQSGDFILTGNITSSNPFDVNLFLMKINSSGDSLWSKQFGGNSDDVGYSVQLASDGGFIVSGYYGISGNPSSYIIKTDSSGNTFTGTDDVTLSKSNFSVYPNPAKDKIFIKALTRINETFQFEIYDLQGKLIYENVFYGELNSFSTEALPSSVYFCKLNYNNHISYLKLVIID